MDSGFCLNEADFKLVGRHPLWQHTIHCQGVESKLFIHDNSVQTYCGTNNKETIAYPIRDALTMVTYYTGSRMCFVSYENGFSNLPTNIVSYKRVMHLTKCLIFKLLFVLERYIWATILTLDIHSQSSFAGLVK